MPKSSLQLLRQRDFLRACQRAKSQIIEERSELSTRNIAMRALHSTAPGYYLEFDYARKVLYTYYGKGTLPATSGPRHDMWLELIDRVEAMRARGWNLTDALSRVLAEGKASQYFMAESTAYRQLRSHRRSPK